MLRREKIVPGDPSDGSKAMSRVMCKLAIPRFVQSARRPNAVADPGESYWSWKHRFGVRQLSATEPTRSQLANGPFWKALFALEDEWDWYADVDFLANLDRYLDAVYNLLLVNEEDRENLPPQLQEGAEHLYRSQREQVNYVNRYLSERAKKVRNMVAMISAVRDAAGQRMAVPHADHAALAEVVIERLKAIKFDDM